MIIKLYLKPFFQVDDRFFIVAKIIYINIYYIHIILYIISENTHNHNENKNSSATRYAIPCISFNPIIKMIDRLANFSINLSGKGRVELVCGARRHQRYITATLGLYVATKHRS